MSYLLEINWVEIREIAKDFIVPLAGSAAGAWATFEVFKRQLEESRVAQANAVATSIREENEQQNKLASRNLQHFTWLLEDVIKYANRQCLDYLNTAAAITANPLVQHGLGVIASSVLSRIFTLKQDDIFFSFVRKALDTPENRRHVAIIYNKLDFINESIRATKLKYEEHIMTYDRIGKEYREFVENIRDLVIDVPSEARRSYSYSIDPLALYLNDVSNDYLEALNTLPEASQLDWQHENYVLTLQRELVRHFRHDDRIDEIVRQGRRTLILIGRIKFSSKETAQFLTDDNAELRIALDELQTEIDFVKAVLATT